MYCMYVFEIDISNLWDNYHWKTIIIAKQSNAVSRNYSYYVIFDWFVEKKRKKQTKRSGLKERMYLLPT